MSTESVITTRRTYLSYNSKKGGGLRKKLRIHPPQSTTTNINAAEVKLKAYQQFFSEGWK